MTTRLATSPPGAVTPSRDHRLEIQGLRALAALLVVIYHLWPGRLPGGYVGVDIFFVISGFLITSHLLREIDRDGRISFAQFWARRARRLLPAALSVIAVSGVATWLWVPQQYWSQFFREMIASAVYVENWLLADDSVDYLAQENIASPVQHYWTLSVEEQFYLVWPLLVTLGLWLAVRFGRDRRPMIAAVLAVVVAASLAHSLYLVAQGVPQAYFAATTRAWEFGAGALLAFSPGLLKRLPDVARSLVSWGALAFMVAAGLLFDEATPVPGLPIVALVAAVVLLIAAGSPGSALSPMPLLRRRSVQWTGDVSYALYLWHWPLIVLLPFVRGRENGPFALVGILVLTFVLAGLSTRLIEDPVRTSTFLKHARPRLTYGLTALAMTAVIVPSLMAIKSSERALQRDQEIAESIAEQAPACFGAASHDPEKPCGNPELDRLQIPDPRSANGDRPPEGWCSQRPVGEAIKPCSGGDWADPDTLKVAIVGDSHARMMSSVLREWADDGKVAWDGYFQSGCVWTTAAPWRIKYVDECVDFKQQMSVIMAEKADQYDLVITTARADRLPGDADARTAGLLEAWSAATDRGVPVVALSDIPLQTRNEVNACLEQTAQDRQADCALDRSKTLVEPDPFVTAAKAGDRTHAIDLRDVLCDERKCPAVIGGVTVYADSNHLTDTFVRTMAPIVWRELARAGLTG
ncbi:acyltransferase family protein [Aeromicrobium duanguangcaii]|uniref:acyltransferase family protein n=1 Tax=Aeromicrobium duanguangcaii TaxID=2968086 RepID=UPI00201722D7|nr:acyltransferase [Aeromicrobium duanguangcaii]